MPKTFHPWAAAASGITVADVRATFEHSLGSDEAPAILTTLVALLPCTPGAIARAPVEMIDRDRGLLRLPDAHGGMVEVALGVHAALAVECAIGGRASGPLVVYAHGDPLDGDPGTESYAAELLAVAAGTPPPPGWSFKALRDAIFEGMVGCGVPQHVAMAQAGLGHRHAPGFGRDAMIAQQRIAADRWTNRLGLLPPSPFIVAHALAIEASRALNTVTIQRGASR